MSLQPSAIVAAVVAAVEPVNNPTAHKYIKIYLIVWFAHTKLSPQARDLIPSLSLLNKYKNVII